MLSILLFSELSVINQMAGYFDKSCLSSMGLERGWMLQNQDAFLGILP